MTPPMQRNSAVVSHSPMLIRRCVRCGQTFVKQNSSCSAQFCSDECAWTVCSHKKCNKFIRRSARGATYCSNVCQRAHARVHYYKIKHFRGSNSMDESIMRRAAERKKKILSYGIRAYHSDGLLYSNYDGYDHVDFTHVLQPAPVNVWSKMKSFVKMLLCQGI